MLDCISSDGECASGLEASSDDNVRKIRVMIWFWGAGGAGTRLTERIAAALSDEMGSANVTVCCHADNVWRSRLVERGHPVTVVKGAAGYNRKLAHLFGALPRFWRLLQHLRQHRPNAVIIPINFALAWPFALLPHVKGIPIIYMLHDAVPHVGDFAPRLQRYTQKRLVQVSRHMIAPSVFTENEIQRLFTPAPPTTLLPLSALVERRRNRPRSAAGRPLRMLFLGRLIAYKGLHLLAEALAPLADRADWSLTIAGAGPEEAAVKGAFDGFRQVDLSMMRLLEEDEVESLIDSHDVLVCPYIDASQSGAIPEALADGMPCIVTPAGALAEQIGGGRAGWVAADCSVSALRNQFLEVLDSGAAYEARSAGALGLVTQGQAGPILATLIRRLAEEECGTNSASLAV